METEVDKTMNFGRRDRRENRRTAPTEEFEFYEDTHNERGEYIGSGSTTTFGRQGDINVKAPADNDIRYADNVSMPMGNGSQRIIVYYPKTPEDVMVLINHLKMNNPVVVKFEGINADIAQRILDFLSGAACALSGTVHRVSGNLFLISPKGVEITIPYVQK